MLKQTFFALIIALAFGVSAEVSTLPTPLFNKVKVSGELNVDCVYCPDSVGTIVIDAPHSEQLPWVEAKVSGDKISLKLVKPDGVTTAGNLPRVTLYTNYLVKAENDGDSTLRVLSTARMPEFEVKLMGNGRVSVHNIEVDKIKASFFAGRGSIVLAGKALRASYNVDGAGTIEADQLVCEEASVRSIGTGTIGVNATRALKISGAGGTVYYAGTPVIKKTMAVGIKVEPLE